MSREDIRGLMRGGLLFVTLMTSIIVALYYATSAGTG